MATRGVLLIWGWTTKWVIYRTNAATSSIGSDQIIHYSLEYTHAVNTKYLSLLSYLVYSFLVETKKKHVHHACVKKDGINLESARQFVEI